MSDQNWQNLPSNEDHDTKKSGAEIMALTLQEYRKKHRERYQKRLDEQNKQYLEDLEEPQKIEEEKEKRWMVQAMPRSHEERIVWASQGVDRPYEELYPFDLEKEQYDERMQEMTRNNEEQHHNQLMTQHDTNYYVPLQEQHYTEEIEREPMRTGYTEQLIPSVTVRPFDIIFRASLNARHLLRNTDPQEPPENPTTFSGFLRNIFSARNVSIGIIIILSSAIFILLLIHYWN